MKHDNENKRIEVKYKGKKYKVIEVIIDMPEYPVFQRKSVDQIELVTEEIASTTPSEVSSDKIGSTDLLPWEERFDKKFCYQKGHICDELLRSGTNAEQVKDFIRTVREEAQREVLEEVKEIISKHNARILNQFQQQGTPEMPIIAYDERVCLIPAMTKATEETLSLLDNKN